MKEILMNLGNLLTGLALLNAAILFAPPERGNESYSLTITQSHLTTNRAIIQQDIFKKKILVFIAIAGVGASVVGGVGEKFKN